MQVQTAQKWFALLRDMGGFALGSYGIIRQTITEHVSYLLLLADLGLVGGPGAWAIIQLFLGSSKKEPEPTTEQSPPSQQPLSSSH